MAPTSATRSGSPTNATPGEDTKATVWRLDSIPGKGKALLATTSIGPGTLILSDPPLLTTACITSASTTERDLASALRALPKDSQRAFLGLHNNYPGGGSPLSNIIRSNGYPMGPAGEGGVFANLSRLNHSCRPNAKHVWNAALRRYTVYAVRPIAEGEEITLSYLPGGTSAERQDVLKSHFRFECKCELCALPEAELKASDARILRAQHLSETIEDVEMQVKAPSKLVRNGLKLLRLYEEEGIVDDRLGNVYWEMFKICNTHRDQARASVFAQRYSEVKRISEGADSLNVLEMVAIVMDPSKDGSFGQALKKREAMKRRRESLDGFEDTAGLSSSVVDVPKEHAGADFEKWLWRQD